MSKESRMFAGIVLITLPTVMFGGLSLLSFLGSKAPEYADNPLRHDLFRAGHAFLERGLLELRLYTPRAVRLTYV